MVENIEKYEMKYDENENEIHIEVKTFLKTNMEFYITSNEYKKLREDPNYRIYYLNNAKASKCQLYIFGKGKLSEDFFEPSTYKVRANFVTDEIII